MLYITSKRSIQHFREKTQLFKPEIPLFLPFIEDSAFLAIPVDPYPV
jgi:hypothetical protein